jgi:hypothetical protein
MRLHNRFTEYFNGVRANSLLIKNLFLFVPPEEIGELLSVILVEIVDKVITEKTT